MSEPTVVLSKDSGVGMIKLNRPELFNAINNQLSVELLVKLNEAKADPQIRSLILTGEGRAFCSGQDLKDNSSIEMKNGNISLGDSVRARYNPLIQLMTQMEKPIIAAVNGVAAGAGCSLALACDIRFIHPQTRFVEAFVKIGLIPDSGSTYFLPRLVGLGRAMEIALTGRDIEADEAIRIGLAHFMISEDRLIEEAFSFAKLLAKGPTRAIGLIKKSLYRGMEGTIEEALEFEAQCQEEAGTTQDFLEGIAAFVQKRKPHYQGK